MPFLTGMLGEGIVDLGVEVRDAGVRGVLGADRITLSDEAYCFRRRVRGEGLSETRRDRVFGGGVEDPAKNFFAGVAGRGRRERAKEIFGLFKEGRPISSFKVEVGFVFPFRFCVGIRG